MAITVRYDDAGLLGSLASQVGSGQGRAILADREQAIVRNVQDHYRQQDRLALEAQRLQQTMANQRRQLASQTPTSRDQRGPTPFSQSVGQARDEQQQQNAYQTPFSLPAGGGGVGAVRDSQQEFSIDAEGQVAGQQRYIDESGQDAVRTIPDDEVRRLGGGFVGGRAPEAALPPDILAKQQYVMSVPDLSDAERNALLILANDPGVTPQSLAVRVDNARSRNRGISQSQRTTFEVQDVDRRIRDAQGEIRRAEQALEVLNLDPANAGNVGSGAGATGTWGGWFGGGGPEPEESREALAAYERYRQARAKEEQLRRQRYGLLNGPAGGTPGMIQQLQAAQTGNGNAAMGGGAEGMSDEELLTMHRQLTGGR